MPRTLLSVAATVFAMAFLVTEALARGYWVRDAYGYVFWVDTGPEPIDVTSVVMLLLIFVAGGFVWMIYEEEQKKKNAAGLPAEIASPQTEEFYHDQTNRVLAYDRYLRAQADQYRQYIETARLEAEAHEVARLIEDHRRRQREGW